MSAPAAALSPTTEDLHATIFRLATVVTNLETRIAALESEEKMTELIESKVAEILERQGGK